MQIAKIEIYMTCHSERAQKGDEESLSNWPTDRDPSLSLGMTNKFVILHFDF